MIDVFIRVHKKEPSEFLQRILTYKNENHLKEYVEYISKHPNVIKVEVVPVPSSNDITYNDYLKEHF